MKSLILLSTLFFSLLATADQVIPKELEEEIARTIEARDWSTEELGQVWITSYFSHDDGTGYIVKGQPESWSFARTGENIDVGFTCGSEYDESELSGSCSVSAKKSGNKWQVAIFESDCTCD